jgi:hypothetical protein
MPSSASGNPLRDSGWLYGHDLDAELRQAAAP